MNKQLAKFATGATLCFVVVRLSNMNMKLMAENKKLEEQLDLANRILLPQLKTFFVERERAMTNMQFKHIVRHFDD